MLAAGSRVIRHVVEQEVQHQLNQALSLQLMNPHQILINIISTEMFIVGKQAVVLITIVIIVDHQVHAGHHTVLHIVIAIVIMIDMKDEMRNRDPDRVPDLDRKTRNTKEGL